MAPSQFVYPDNICNGLWEYRPDFGGEVWKKGAMKVENVDSGPEGLAAENGKTGTVVWKITSPYAFVGGHLETEASGARFAVSSDGTKWTDIAGGNFDQFFPLEGNPYYQYQLRCELPAGAKLKRLAVINDLQMALLALPEMTVGENRFTYTDKSSDERKVRITHECVERSTSKPPEAPEAVYPPDGGQAEGTDFAFRWSVPKDPDGDKITDYRFMLANRQDMRWPLSTNFDKLISRTADKGKAQYVLPGAGLLTGDKTYYWRVQAKDEKGVWGPWSKTFNFTPQAPNYPVEVALSHDRDKGIGMLKWNANPVGQKPVKYRVYGSDEKGFSVSDVPYKVSIGTSKELKPEFPANFIAETTATELAVMGDGIESPNANQTYYRVVAVDAPGKRSGPSDYATAPRPTVYGNACQSRHGVPWPTSGQPLFGRPAAADCQRQGDGQLLGHRKAQVRHRARAGLAEDRSGHSHAFRHARRRREGRCRGHRNDRPGSAKAGRRHTRLGQREGDLNLDGAGGQRHAEVFH
jgi:hypothetical protein